MDSSHKRRIAGEEAPQFFALTNDRDGNCALSVKCLAKDPQRQELVKIHLEIFFQGKPSRVQEAT